MPVLYANNAVSALSASITNVATSFSVTAGHGARFPVIAGGDYFYATLMDSAGNLEVVKVTARATDTFTVQRAQEGTTARAYAANDIVELRITKAMLDDFKTDTRTGYLPLTGGTVTGLTTFSNVSDTQIYLNGGGTSWAGISWTDVSGTDYTWFNGSTSTFAIGGGGSAVSGKKLHVHGGMTIGSGYATTSNATNGLNVEGAIQAAGYLTGSNSFEKLLGVSFPNGTANLAANIQFGNLSFWGYIEVEVTGTYSNQNAAGKLTKLFAVGTNVGNLIYNNVSRIADVIGTISDSIAIGDFAWNAANSNYIIPISHIGSLGNDYTIRVRMFTHSGSAATVFPVLAMSANYTLTSLAAHTAATYNSNLLINGTSQVLSAGNYNSYSPTLTGTGASGSWGISVTGSAATLSVARTIGGVSFNGSANIDLPGVNTIGNQSIAGTNVAGNAPALSINAASSTASGYGGDLTLSAGNSSGTSAGNNGGLTIVKGGNNTSAAGGSGAYLELYPGAAVLGSGGQARLYSGDSKGSNIDGVDLMVFAGRGTGTGVGGTIRIYTSSPTTAGSGLQTHTSRLEVSNLGQVFALAGIASTSTTTGTIRVTGGVGVSGQVHAAGFTGPLTGNASTATNVAYSGLTGTVPTWNQNTTGNAATATTANALNTANAYTGTGFTASGAVAYVVANRTSVSSGQVGYNWAQGGTNIWWNYLDASATTMYWYNSVATANVMTLTTGGALNTLGAITQNGSQVLTAGNYNSYAPTLTGTGASGSWGISVTGNAATATNVAYSGLTGTVPTWNQNTTGSADTVNSITGNTGLMVNRLTPVSSIDGLTATNFRSTLFGTASNNNAIATARWNTTPAPLSGLSAYGTMIAWAGSDTQGFLAVNYDGANAKIGGGNAENINWTATLIHSSNYNSYSPTLTGTGASGTWGISITGNAATATTATNLSGGTVSATSMLASQGLSDTYAGLRLVNPGGGSHVTSAGTITGAIKIRLPAAANNSNTMVRLTVKIYEYSTGLSRTLEVGGYNYGPGNWYNWFATQQTQSGGDLQVRFGYDATSDCIWIGETTSTWSYPQVFITDVQCGYSAYTQAMWASGWVVGFATSFDTVDQITTAYRPLSSGNYNSYAPSLTGSGASGTWGISITGNAATATTATNWGTYGGVPSAGTSFGNANTIGRSDANGYTYFGYINSSTGNSENGTVGQVIVTNGTDNFYRKASIGHLTSNLSGTAPISITGNAATASSVSGLTLTSSANGINPDSVTQNQIGYNTSVSLFGQSDGGLYSSAYSSSWIHQIYGDFRSGQIAIRGKNSGTWQAWRAVIDSGNYNNYAPTLTGTGASGTWGISITGTAANVTGVVAVANGGTGLTSIAARSIPVANTANTYTTVTPAAGQSVRVNAGNTAWEAYTPGTGTVTSVTATAPVASTGGTTPVISMPAATTSVSGYLTSTDWNTFNGKGNGTVTGVTATSPVASSGGTAPVISMAAATASVNGYMTSTYAAKLDGIAAGATANTGTVTSVATSGTVSGLTLTGGTITTTGTITLGGTLAVTPSNFASQTAKTFLAAPNGAAGTPTFRAMVASDVPTLNQNTTGSSGSCTGNAATATSATSATTATNATNTAITNDTTTATAQFITFVGASSGNTGQKTHSTGLTFVPSTGAFTASGNVTAYSDERLKKDWAPVAANFVSRLATVKSGTYTRTDNGERQAGSSAQDWQKLLPEVVAAGADDKETLSLAYGNAALVSAVELAKEVVELRAKLVRLEAIVAKLIED